MTQSERRPAVDRTPNHIDDCAPEFTAHNRQAASGRGDELLRQMRRRYEAAKRLPGGDPLSSVEQALGRSREHPRSCRAPLTPKHLDAAAAAAGHLLSVGLAPIVDIATCRALWRRGGHDRKLAELLHRGCGGAMA